MDSVFRQDAEPSAADCEIRAAPFGIHSFFGRFITAILSWKGNFCSGCKKDLFLLPFLKFALLDTGNFFEEPHEIKQVIESGLAILNKRRKCISQITRSQAAVTTCMCRIMEAGIITGTAGVGDGLVPAPVPPR